MVKTTMHIVERFTIEWERVYCIANSYGRVKRLQQMRMRTKKLLVYVRVGAVSMCVGEWV